jgi:hypothetical protein
MAVADTLSEGSPGVHRGRFFIVKGDVGLLNSPKMGPAVVGVVTELERENFAHGGASTSLMAGSGTLDGDRAIRLSEWCYQKIRGK